MRTIAEIASQYQLSFSETQQAIMQEIEKKYKKFISCSKFFLLIMRYNSGQENSGYAQSVFSVH